MRSLSNLATGDPGLILELVRTNRWDAARIESLVRMLPLETVDQPAERLRLVRQRLVALRQVREARLRAVRAIAIDALEEYEAELSR